MLRNLAKLYITNRRNVVFSLLILGLLLITSAIILKESDDLRPSRRDKVYCEKQILKLTNSFDDLSHKWFNSEITPNTKEFNKSIAIFNNYECIVALYRNGKIVYISSNAVEPDSVSHNIIKNNDHYLFTGSRQTIPIIKRSDTNCALLLITLATQNNHINTTKKIELNKKLIPSKNIQITSYSELGEKICSADGKHLFSFTYNSKSDNWILIEILLTLGLILITITSGPYISEQNNKYSFNRVLVTLVSILFILFLVDIFNITQRLLWIAPIVVYIYTNIIFHLIKKRGYATIPTQHYIPTLFRNCYNIIISLFSIFLTYMIIHSVSTCNEFIYAYSIPIILLTAAYLNLLFGYSIVNRKERVLTSVLNPIIISTIATFVSYFIDIRIFTVMSIITIPTIVILTFHKQLNRITIFYITTLSVSVACAYIISGIEHISIFGNTHAIPQLSHQLNFYMSLVGSNQTYSVTTIDSAYLHNYFTIILYSTTTIIASTILLLEKKIYRVQHNSMSRKVHITLYLTIAIILALSIILSTNFVRSIKQESTNMYINRICNSIVIDYIDTCTNIEEWIEKRETNYNINIDIYSKEGILLHHSVKDTNALTIIPKRINSDLVNTINQFPNKNHIITDSYVSRISYLSAYAAIPGNLILHLPFDEQYTMQNFYPMITRFINIFICSLLILLFITTIIYDKLTRPLEILNRNMNIMRARKRISLKELHKSNNSEVASIINEYNKMITELENQYRLQITVERQNTWNKLIRLIAHEVKNPLTPILLKSQMILYRKAKGDESWKELIEDTLNTIIEQTKRISGLITTMMESPEKYIGSGENIDVIPLLENIKKFYSAYSRIHFNIINHTPETDATIYFNRDNLWSVISNITTNAIDAIISKNSINGNISFFVTTTESKLTIKIYNNGETIPQDIIAKIFDFSFTTKADGNGLGLYLVQQIIKMEEGDVSVISSSEIGTEFIITIPRHKKDIKGTTGKIAHLE